MKHRKHNRSYSARRMPRYPNEAEPSYYINRIYTAIAALITGMGTVTYFILVLTL